MLSWSQKLFKRKVFTGTETRKKTDGQEKTDTI
jgi:hypothetical protein